MIISLIIYILFALTLYALGTNEWVATKNRYRVTGHYSTRWTTNTYVLLSIIIIMSALRYRVGIDCESYVNIYHDLNTSYTSGSRFEPGFIFIVNILKNIGAGRIVYLGLLAALEFIPFYYALRTRKFLYPYIGLILIMGPFYLIWMNGIRQSIAACFFVLASVVLVDQNKRLLAGLIILFAAQIHASSYILFIVLLLPVWDVFKKRNVNIAILLFCVIAGQFGSVAMGLLSSFVGLNIEGDAYMLSYINGVDKVLEQEASMGFGPRRLLTLLWSVIAIWYEPKMKKAFNNDKFFVYTFNLFFIHICLCENLLSNVSYLFRRPFYFTYPFEFLFFVYLLYYMKYFNRGKNHKIMFIITLGLSCSYIFAQSLADVGVVDETTFYKFIFLHS